MAQVADFSQGAGDASAVILSLSGLEVTPSEREVFENVKPLGFILFQRNCDNPQQVKALTNTLREIVGRDCPILIDQEGGRVARLKPPHWSVHPPCNTFGDKACNDLEGALSDLRYRTLRIADDLCDSGINVNCDPVMDITIEGAHDVIGDRSFSADPALVGRLGVSVCRHYLSAGITPIIKHIPGHGRALLDSHDVAPVIDASAELMRETDFVPFKIIVESDVAKAVWAMPSPVIYSAFDGTHPACVSPKMIKDVIREEIGFDGIVVSDALDMGGFSEYGTAVQRVLAVLDAGCDIALHCTGKIDEMQDIAKSVPKITEKALERLHCVSNFRKMAA